MQYNFSLSKFWEQTFMGYTELPNELNEREIKTKTSQKRFSACHRDRRLPSFLHIVKTKFCWVSYEKKWTVGSKNGNHFDFCIYSSKVMDQNIRFQ